MKKIYIFAAVLALLTLSLNAQNDAKKVVEPAPHKVTMASNVKAKPYTGKNATPTMNELLAGINGMSGILPSRNPNGSSTNGQMRAPMKINAGETTVGPFEGDNFSTNGLGYPTAYGENGQQIYIFADLDRAQFVDHDGDEIVGFRFALAGDATQTAVLYDFMAWPYSSNGWFEAANRHTWSIPGITGAQPINIYDDIVITTSSYYAMFTSITIYGDNDAELVSWNTSTSELGTTTSGSTCYVLPDGWDTGNYYMSKYNDYGYISNDGSGTLTISSDYLTGQSSVRVEISGIAYQSGATMTIGSETWTMSTSGGTHSWTISPSGTSTPIYVELQAGQWHEYYLDQPITFNVNDTIAGMYLGYRYFQYPSTETSELLYPIAVNPQSTGHDHVSYMVKQNGSTTSEQLLTGWDYATDVRNFPSTWTVPTVGGAGSLSGSLWFSGSSGGTFTIPASDLQGCSTVTVKVTAGKENSSTHSISVNNSAQNLTQQLVEYTWENVSATNGITLTYSDYYVNISKIEVYGTVTVPNYQSGWWTEDFSQYGDLAVQLIFKSSLNPTIEITPATQTINDAAAGTLTVTGTDIEGNINVSAGNDWSVNPTSLGNTGGDVSVSYTGRDLSASTTVTAEAANDNTVTASATVDYVADLYIVGDYGSGWNFSDNSNHMTYNNGTYTTTITVNANDYILFARLLGNDNPWNTRDIFGPVSSGDWGMQGDSYGGDIDLYDDDPIYFPEGGTYRITIDANNNTFTITKLNGEQTASPVIDYTVSSDGQHVTITATGDGTVTLNVPGYDPVSGEGEVSITVPCGYVSNTITVSATAQESGKDESDPTYRDITIPAGSDWVEMDGTYDDPNDLLSFLKDGEDIMMLDQFTASTLNNSQPASYIYTLREGQPGGEQKMSTPVPIPVYKTFSTMQGVYTKNQVDNDKNMKLKANVLNAEMDFDVKPDGNVLYYNLYRSNLNGDYPVIDDTHRVSKLQQFDEQVGDYSQFYLFESHTSGVIPRYDHFGNGIVERLDTNYVQGEEGNELSYVPVIWTLGINSARGDGKDNSYGSDIKRETMGNVTAKISGETTAGNAFGTWKVGPNETEYCVFHPTIEVTGVLPQAPLYRVDYNDGDYAEYEPYMCRAWCTYEGIHDFIRNSDGNLQDAGALTTPYWLGDATFDNSLSATIGGDWTGGAIRDQWSFGLPSGTNPNEVTYIIRFYYKKVVTDAQNQQNGGSGAKVGGEDEVYFMTQTGGEYGEWVVGINELYTTIVPVDVTYVNPQGMKSSRPFDGVNIVVTRYSDGSTRTSKIIR